MKATDVLEKAAGHMRDRAATYDKPEGERSMARTVAAFNAITGRDLTTAEGWAFMLLLKQVRVFQNPAKPHQDSLEDGVAYAALLAEEMLSTKLKVVGVDPAAGPDRTVIHVVAKETPPAKAEKSCETCKYRGELTKACRLGREMARGCKVLGFSVWESRS